MKQLKEFKTKVELEIKKFFEEKEKKASKIDKFAKEVIILLKKYTLNGGKRLRASFLYYGYKCFSSNEKDLIKASIAMELIQSYLLIHDDIIDNDDYRRGKPAFHVQTKKISKDGKGLAIIAGDICFSLANELISSTSFKDSKKIKALKFMNRMNKWVCYGQVLDLISNNNKNHQLKDTNKINILKTAMYTTYGPLVLGAILAGANDKKIKQLEKYALPLGEAFQIQDDILGMFGNEKKIGKPIGSDIKEGKKTLLYLKAIEFSKEKDKTYLKKQLGRKQTKTSINKIRKIITKCGSLNYCNNKNKELIQKSKKEAEKMKFKKEGKIFLIDICDYLENRKY